MAQPLRAGIYARISSDTRGLALGVQRQVEDCERLAGQRQWMVAERYIDNDVSASTKTDKVRPEFERMLRDVENGSIDGIIVYNMDRLTRRMVELAGFLQWLDKVHVPFMTLEGDDTETASGRMIIQIKGAVAQQEAERIAERVTRAKKQARDDGHYYAPTRPFGWTDGTFTKHNPKEAEAIRTACDMAIQGASVVQIAKYFMREGITTVRGKHWQRITLKRTIVHPRNAGFMQYDGEIVGKSKNINPIIDEATWRAVDAAMAARVQRRERHGARTHLLSGYVFCAACGSKMVAQVSNATVRRARWACSKVETGGCGSVSRNYDLVSRVVDQVVRDALGEIQIGNPDSEGSAFVEEMQTEIDELEAEIVDARSRWLTKELEKEDYYATVSDLRAAINDRKRQQTSLMKSAKAAALVTSTDAMATWERDDLESLYERRAIVESLIERIMIKPLGRSGPTLRPESIDIILRAG